MEPLEAESHVLDASGELGGGYYFDDFQNVSL
jgi:hypothetical protein